MMKPAPKIRIFFVLVLVSAFTTQIWCQEELQVDPDPVQLKSYHIEYPNTIKLNVAALAFKKTTLLYERQINGHWSFVAAGGYKFMGKIPKWTGLGDFVIASQTRGIRGITFAPEIRYRFWNTDCEQQSGFYAGAYGLVGKLFGEMVFKYWDGAQYIDVGGAGDLWEYAFGVQLGYELELGEHWTMDFMFFGPRLSRHRLNMSLDSQFASEVIPQIEEEINKRLENLGMDPVSIPTNANVSLDFGFRNFRYALAVGYRF